MNARAENLLWALATIVFIGVGSYLVAVFARWIAARLRLSPSEQRRIFWGFLFASPWIIGFVIFVVGPSLASLYYSFTEYRLGESPEWIGLENYQELIQALGRDGRNFRSAMYNSLYYAVVGVPLQVTISLVMALLLNVALRGVRAFRLIYYMPVILAGGPAILLAWRYMFSSNGGFVNEALNGIAGSLAPLDWLYRAFIFVVEGFNGFFIGLTRGDPAGPLNFFLPGLLGTLVCFLLLRGDWEAGKRTFARTIVEVIVFGIGGLLLAVGLMNEPVDVTWLFVVTLVFLAAIGFNLHQRKLGRTRAIQMISLGVLAVLIAALLVAALPADAEDSIAGYVAAAVVAFVAVAMTLLPGTAQARYRLLLFGAVILIGLVLVRLVPASLGDGKVDILIRYLTLQSAIEQPDNLDYLQTGFTLRYMDSVWLFGVIALVAAGAVFTGARRRRMRRYLLGGALIVFLLITVSSALDTGRYFGAYEALAEAEGRPVYHFARFRDATGTWPDENHNPKWLSSDLWVKPSLILINMWSAGAGMLIFLAALKGVPKSLYEAARVDGANRLQQFWKITMPLISPAMFYNVVIGMIGALQTFEPVYILRTTETETSVMSAAFYLYRRTFEQANIGEGSAMSWLLAVVIVGLTIAQFRYSSWVNYEV